MLQLACKQAAEGAKTETGIDAHLTEPYNPQVCIRLLAESTFSSLYPSPAESVLPFACLTSFAEKRSNFWTQKEGGY